MKRLVSMLTIAVALPFSAVAQDDMYFVPTKANVEKSARDFGMPRDTYYSGSDRSVDDYNRRGSLVQDIDSAGNDIVDFDAVSGVYPASSGDATSEDYTYTRRMSRFDDYAWSDPYWAGYYAGRSSLWWNDPWCYSGWYYDPWYYGWHADPWYHGWYGWHGYWGWGGHWGWGAPHYVVAVHGGHRGTRNPVRGTGWRSPAGLGGVRSMSNGVAGRSRTFTANGRNRTFSASERFGVSRNSTPARTGSQSVRNSTPSGSTNTVRSSGFGGSRSGGSFSGGSRSGGSRGGFGGRR